MLFLLPNWTPCVLHFEGCNSKLKLENFFLNSKWWWSPALLITTAPYMWTLQRFLWLLKWRPKSLIWFLVRTFHNLYFVSLFSLIWPKLALILSYKDMNSNPPHIVCFHSSTYHGCTLTCMFYYLFSVCFPYHKLYMFVFSSSIIPGSNFFLNKRMVQKRKRTKYSQEIDTYLHRVFVNEPR